MDWLKEILKKIDNSAYLVNQIENKITSDYVLRRDYEILGHNNNVLENMVKDYEQDMNILKQKIQDNEYYQKFQELSAKYEEETASLKQQIADNKLEYLLEKEISKAGGRNPKAIKALLDMEEIALDEDGQITGLDLATIQQSDPYLFETVESTIIGTGNEPSRKTKLKTNSFIASARRAAGLE